MRDYERFRQLSGGPGHVRDLRRAGRIISGGQGIYHVQTDAGAIVRAEASGEYLPGQRVSVLAGRIIGMAAGSRGVEAVRG